VSTLAASTCCTTRFPASFRTIAERLCKTSQMTSPLQGFPPTLTQSPTAGHSAPPPALHRSLPAAAVRPSPNSPATCHIPRYSAITRAGLPPFPPQEFHCASKNPFHPSCRNRIAQFLPLHESSTTHANLAFTYAVRLCLGIYARTHRRFLTQSI
jgi:hypothetical protein